MKQSRKFKMLFEPIRIGSMELKNRVVMLPLENNYAAEDGLVTERTKNYYAERAKEVGLVIVQITCIDAPIGKAYRYQLCIDNDRHIPGLSELAQTIHKCDAKAIIQLHHAGANVKGHEIVAASAIPVIPGVVPRELSVPEIKEIISRYVTAAQRAKKAGFDGVEVVASGGYLVWGFLSPAWNKRRDEYGGDLPGRARFFLEIISAIKESLGKDFPVTCRLAIREYVTPGGMTVRETQEVAKMAQDAGLDAVTMTALGGTANFPSSPGALLPLARAIKQAVTIPVTATGRMDLEVGERAIIESKGDLVGIGRRLVADTEYVSKAASGREDEIVPCIGCMQCLHTSLILHEPMRCAVNPACGKEEESRLNPASIPKRVFVVGGGPAGMEAAITAGKRGYELTLYEKEPKLGGQLNLASIPPDKEHIVPFTNYLINQIKKLGIKVELGKEATKETVEAAKPDAVVFATGVKNIIPDIPGMDKAHVVTVEDAVTGRAEVGMEVVVIGGDQVGCETAEFLVEKGRKVTIVEILESMATKMSPYLSAPFLERLARKGIAMYTGVKREEFKNSSLVITTKEGEEKTIEVNTIVLATGSKPNSELFQELKDRVPEVYCVGDCVEPRNIMEATTEGFNIGRTI